MNECSKATDISTYDFSTLYTNIQHDELAFSGGNYKEDGSRKYLPVTGTTVLLTKSKHGKNSFTKE